MKRAFESDVKVGELRIFADLERPVVALIVEDLGVFGFRVIPVSDFTAVSCEGEKRFGERVYQFWNVCSVPRSFASRSWVVASLPPSEFELIRSQPAIPLTHLSSYQRAYLFSAPRLLNRLERGAPSRRIPSVFVFSSTFRKVAGWAVAACVVLALVFAVNLDLDRASYKEERSHAWNLVMKPSEPETLEAVAEEVAESESAVVAANAPRFELAPPENAGVSCEPEIGGEIKVPRMTKVNMRSSFSAENAGRYELAVMRALERRTTDEHAIAVLTYLACGVNAGDAEFGSLLVESTERLIREAGDGGSQDEYTRRLVATALCRAYVATSNPELKAVAESALDRLGDKRAVEIVARRYGLLEDWFASRQSPVLTEPGRVAVSVSYPDWFRFLLSRP